MPQVRSNRDIDSFIIHGEFEIDLDFAFSQLSNYLQELDALESGASFQDLGIHQRRESMKPGVITLEDASARVISDPSALYNEEATPSGSFAHLKLTGVMRSEDSLSTRGITSLISDIQAANQNPKIRGILIEANTGGGESIAGQMLKSAIEGSSKPVVVFAHQLASAGVRGTLPASEIIASGGAARIGSIGTMVSITRGFREFYNRNFQDIYADQSSNKNREFRAYLNGDLKPLRQNLNRSNGYFTKEVQRYRNLKGNIENTLSGELFFAITARRRGLIDGIGSFAYAVQRLSAIANNPEEARGTQQRKEIQLTENIEEMSFKDKIRALLNTEGEEEFNEIQETPAPETEEADQPEESQEEDTRLEDLISEVAGISETMQGVQNALEALTVRLNEQGSQIDQVSASIAEVQEANEGISERLEESERAIAQLQGTRTKAVENKTSQPAEYSETEKAFRNKILKPSTGIALKK